MTASNPAQPIGTTQPNHAQALLPQWANNHDNWCRAIVTDILKSRVQASDTAIDGYLKLLFAEKKLSDESFEPVPKIEQKEIDANPLDAVCLGSMKIEDGVNALKPGTEIVFSPGVTVIFGENGAGKSGFVRVLKRAAGVRTAEDILPNVRSEKRAKPCGSFTATVGAATETIAWRNDFGIAPLNRVNIFDARGARLHVEDDLTYIYTPGELTLFPLVQNAVERVRTALDDAISARTPGTNTILNLFDRSSSIYPTIETLGAATDLEELRKYAALPDNAETTIDSLTTEIAALNSTNIQNELKRARDRLAVVTAIKTTVETANLFDPTVYARHVTTLAEATKRRDEAGSKAFDSSGIPGVLGDEWRRFIQAGEEYLQKHTEPGYPRETDRCAYCQQSLANEALALIKKYRDYSSNEIKIALDFETQQLANYTKPLLNLDLDLVSRQLDAEVNGGGDVLAAVVPVVVKMKTLQEAVATRSAAEWDEKKRAIPAAQTLINREETRLKDHITSLQKSITERAAALKAKQAELIELQAKKTASSIWPQLQSRVSDAKWVARSSIVKGNFTGVLRSLTESAKVASDELLNKDFGRRFEHECKLLRAPAVTLNFPGRQGQATRRKLVAAYKPTDVLSEGEQKALALADFLAEVSSIPAASPVVFDDPITSMDYRRIHEVCDRVIALSEDHQVIVFTHNIWFAAEMLTKADKKRLKYYDIRQEGSEAGVVSAALYPRMDTIAQVSARVKKMIDAAEKQQGEVKAALVEKGYEELRGFCELIAEQEMLKGVSQRYAPNVMMTKLSQINVDSLKDSIAALMPVFEKSCRYIASHSQPPETQGIRPTLDELKADYAKVLGAREPHKQ